VILGATGRGRAPAVTFAPLGTANVATRAFGLPRRAAGIAALVASGRSRTVDVGVVLRDGRPDDVFLLWCGVGLDGALIHRIAARRVPDRGWRVMWRYAVGTVATFAEYRFPPVRVESEHVRGEFGAVILANVGPIALGSVTRRANPRDGALDLIATRARSRVAWFLSGMLALAHLYDLCPGVSRTRETRVRLSSGAPVAVQVDGEPAGHLPIEVEVRPGALRLAAPALDDAY